jgi:hypothetical protein
MNWIVARGEVCGLVPRRESKIGAVQFVTDVRHWIRQKGEIDLLRDAVPVGLNSF